MVEILCPHCEGKIELDDDASGEFKCPHCERGFEWNITDDDSPIADPGSGKFASMYAWLLNKASLVFTPVPLIWALVLLPISLLAGLVMIILSANFFIAGSALGSWMLEELVKFDFSEALELFMAITFVIVIFPIALLAFLIAISIGLVGLLIIGSAIVRLIRR
tara:strand:- start:155 stop:646 length:492 start_codon:yes stop_codon:yes gene_type:complete